MTKSFCSCDGVSEDLFRTNHSNQRCAGAGVAHDPAYAVIVAGGAIEDPDKAPVRQASLLIAADSGAEFLRKHGLTPNFLIGDFDSLSEETAAHFKSHKIREVKFIALKPLSRDSLLQS